MKVEIFMSYIKDGKVSDSVKTRINNFCSTHDIIDIKVACTDLNVVYTVLYRGQ